MARPSAKQKSAAPNWRARWFEAAPAVFAALAFAAGAWSLPIVLADVALLTNGLRD